jgi:hypothetical protein
VHDARDIERSRIEEIEIKRQRPVCMCIHVYRFNMDLLNKRNLTQNHKIIENITNAKYLLDYFYYTRHDDQYRYYKKVSFTLYMQLKERFNT